MNAADLIAFLSGDLAADELQQRIAPEVQAWAERLSERGRSAPISVFGMRQPVDVTPERAARLLDAFIRNDVSQESFAYLLDALLIEQRFRWTSILVREILEHVLGSEYPRKLDKERAWRAKAELKELAANGFVNGL